MADTTDAIPLGPVNRPLGSFSDKDTAAGLPLCSGIGSCGKPTPGPSGFKAVEATGGAGAFEEAALRLAGLRNIVGLDLTSFIFLRYGLS